MVVVGIGTMALIIVLSVFNGLEGLLKSTYGNFDPEIIITPKIGKSFIYSDTLSQKVRSIEAVDLVAIIIEDNVLIKYNNAQRVVRLKGVSDDFIHQKRLQGSMVYGDFKLSEGNLNYALVGRGVQFDLLIYPNNEFYSIQVYYPNQIKPGLSNPSKIYTVQQVMPAGIFAIEKHIDENYLFVSLEFAASLMNYGTKRTALEISLIEGADAAATAKKLSALLGDDFNVLTGDELHADLFKFMKWEKLIVFLTFSLIIAIASINIYFSLTMLAIDKKKDIAILSALGAPFRMIRNIFLYEGMIIAFTGAGLGLLLGLSIASLQQKYGFITMGMQSALMNAYPVEINPLDVFLTAGSIILITFLAAIQPAFIAARNLSTHTL